MQIRQASRFVAFLLVAAAASAAVAGNSYVTYAGQLAADAVSNDSAKSSAAIVELRKMGPAGLDALFTANAATLDARMKKPTEPNGMADWQRLKTAIDQVAGQKDAYASHLYWYTDHAEATKAAAEAHKPILTLFMLGKLTDDLSCANSRFFRTTLYSNAEVSAYLRTHFILEWQSERPVPKITIDMGDGRKIERTITGNSIHYVLDEKGRVVDGVPGLYGAKAFLTRVAAGEQQAKVVGSLDDAKFMESTVAYHAAANELINGAWEQDMAAVSPVPEGSTGTMTVSDLSAQLFLGEKKSKTVPTAAKELDRALTPSSSTVTPAVPATGALGASGMFVAISDKQGLSSTFPTAVQGGVISIGKGAVEMPVVRAIAPQQVLMMSAGGAQGGASTLTMVPVVAPANPVMAKQGTAVQVIAIAAPAAPLGTAAPVAAAAPTAVVAGAVPITKAKAELAVTKAIVPEPAAAPPAMMAMKTTVSKTKLEKIPLAAITPEMLKVIEAKAEVKPNPTAAAAGAVADGKWDVERPVVNAVVPQQAPPKQAAPAFPQAREAGDISASKLGVELPMFAAMGWAQVMPKDAPEDIWLKIATLHAQVSVIDRSTAALIEAKNPALASSRVATMKTLVESPMLRMIRNLQGSIAMDTVKNEYTIHVMIHQWLGMAGKPVELRDFNERVYAELFLTPKSDPWLGLVPADTYSALDNEGFCPVDGAK